ncbi:MAG: hypothetical protein CL840_13990 [Crocinitomicaceae bacterium]|nr:hypothetical protein [Crocinitomicaceae bacterium]|tara:strand:+ start:13229 stop:13888 length:660 start_codon:yes stop_codon:yes gene_type:complete
MKQRFFILCFVVLSIGGFSQKGSFILSAYTGFSSYNEHLAKREVKNWLKREYSKTVSVILFSWKEIPNVKYYISYTTPIGGRLAFGITHNLTVGAEVNYSRVEVRADFDDEDRTLVFVNERYNAIPLIIYRPNPRLLVKTGLDFYIIYGIGYRQSKKEYTTIVNGGIVSEEIESGNPFLLKVGVGLAYFPIKPLGIQLELGTGMTNFQFGLIFKTKGKA